MTVTLPVRQKRARESQSVAGGESEQDGSETDQALYFSDPAFLLFHPYFNVF